MFTYLFKYAIIYIYSTNKIFFQKDEVSMFQVGDYVVYGCKGVCQVKEITTMKMEGIPKGKLYYQLQPCAQAASRIFTPVEPGNNNKSVMRAVLTKEEASRLLEETDAEGEWIKDDRIREAKYKEIINGCDAVSLLKMIRMLYQRRAEREAGGRHLPALDGRYLHMAEEILFSELSLTLECPAEKIKERV